MTGLALGQGEQEDTSTCPGQGIGPHQMCQQSERNSQSWASKSPPQTEIETHFRDKWGNGPGTRGVGCECHWGGPWRHSFLRALTAAMGGHCRQTLLTHPSSREDKLEFRVPSWIICFNLSELHLPQLQNGHNDNLGCICFYVKHLTHSGCSISDSHCYYRLTFSFSSILTE